MRISSTLLAVVAVTYALLAGLHTLQDFDLWWQLATGRWVWQHHHVFSTDVFSYTASGQPWIYPAFSGVIFYAAFLAGGYAHLCWLGALTCAGTVAMLLRRNSLALSVLALIAVPLLANRTQPRAEMFTTILFAAFLAMLWRYHRTGQARLWLLPVLMVAWVNLHPGFVAGLVLCGAYLFVESLELPYRERREAAMQRLKRAWPWLVLTAVATLVNPWGIFAYSALLQQARAQSLHNQWVVEWGGIHPSWSSWHQAIDWRDPQSAFWWLIAVALIATVVAVWRERWGAAILLCASAYLAFQHVRLQALMACVTVIVGGALLDESRIEESWSDWIALRDPLASARLRSAATAVVAVALAVLAGVRSVDLITNRVYLRSNQLALFGSGISWWYPERAVDFVQREKPPAQMFNGYTLGGYLGWRLFPAYRDYIDSRALPFGSELFFRAYDLSARGPDSSAWRQETDARGINTIVVPLSRYQGMTLFPQLHAFCHSRSWSPVYLDEVSAVFVRRNPQTESLIARLQIDCDKVAFDLPSDLGPSPSSRTKAELFNAWANAGGVLYSLERYPEALAYLRPARNLCLPTTPTSISCARWCSGK